MRHFLALLLTLVLTIGLGMALDRLGEASRVTWSYTALL
jgi:hypothetical protein